MLSFSLFEEAICSPLTQFLIPVLRNGEVVRIPVTTANGQTYEKLWSQSGGMATVYKFSVEDRYQAVRFFHGPVPSSLQKNYEDLSAYTHRHPRLAKLLAHFTYYPEGLVLPQRFPSEEHEQRQPVMVMDWVEGETLLAHVHSLCLRGDRDGLGKLRLHWYRVVACMEALGCAHGDLSGDNVMVQADGQCVLVDCDTFFIPPFAGQNIPTFGHADYQHPQWTRRPFDARMDDFSRHVIYIALRALQHEPSLWRDYGQCGGEDDYDVHLLFTEEDFRDPGASRLFRELAAIDDALLQEELNLLRAACNNPLEAMCLPSLPAGEDGVSPSGHQPQVYCSPLSQEVNAIGGSHPAGEGVWAQEDPITGDIVISWNWAEDAQYAALAWRPDHWADTPQEEGTYLYQPIRRRHGQTGSVRFSAPEYGKLYLHLYWATLVPGTGGEQFSRPLWEYKAPVSFTSRIAFMRASSTVVPGRVPSFTTT